MNPQSEDLQRDLAEIDAEARKHESDNAVEIAKAHADHEHPHDHPHIHEDLAERLSALEARVTGHDVKWEEHHRHHDIYDHLHEDMADDYDEPEEQKADEAESEVERIIVEEPKQETKTLERREPKKTGLRFKY